ncbi:hypothetical protein DMB66_21260 [Actinoplanes sp. ATCC 53533]|nr:hypothetical protein DMB66_21260 [Actinoplanes sp. ATCC 53533]
MCCDVNSGAAPRWPGEAETVLAAYPIDCLTLSRATTPATSSPVRPTELPAVFEQAAAPLILSAAAEVARPFDDGKFLRHATRLRRWPQLQALVSGGAGTGKLP